MRHTPAPWHVESDSAGIRVTTAEGLNIALCIAAPNRSLTAAAANARLIAASPKLLAAAQRSLDWLASYPGGTPAAYDELREAIREAQS